MDWREQIEANGFAIRQAVVAEEWLNEALNEDIQQASARSKAGLRHAMSFGSVRQIAECPAMTNLAREVLGNQVFPFRATIFDKNPSANWLVVWHQDTALPLRYEMELPGWGPWSTKLGVRYAHAPSEALCQVLALRLHLDDSTPNNGPLRILPGTHRLGVLSDDRVHELSEEIAPVECVVAKGGVVAMRPLVVHASSKSQADKPRRVLHIEYAASKSIAKPLELQIT